MTNNWTHPQDMASWMRAQEKQQRRLERRQGTSASAMLGPGFGPHATVLLDWNQEEARYNGFFFSAGDAANVPEPGHMLWLGLCISTGDHTIQLLWSHGMGPTVHYRRAVHIHENRMPSVEPWESA